MTKWHGDIPLNKPGTKWLRLLIVKANTRHQIEEIAEARGYSKDWVLHTLVSKGMAKYQGSGLNNGRLFKGVGL